jgi:hypothetical protein
VVTQNDITNNKGLDFTRDVGLVPRDFAQAANGPIQLFVRQLVPAPPPNWIGDGASVGTITPGPAGINYVNLTGPAGIDLDGMMNNFVQSDQFTISGRLPQIPAVYASFPGLGLWKWNGSSWSQLTSDNPESMAASGSTLYGDFGALGLWKWNGSGWSQLSPDNPENLAATGSMLYGDFGALGLWEWNGSSWSLLTSDNPENVAASGSMLYGDFGALGLWKWNGSSWSQLTPDNPAILITN